MAINDPQIKKDTRRDAWDRDIMGIDWVRPEQESTRKLSNATPVFLFGLFFLFVLFIL